MLLGLARAANNLNSMIKALKRAHKHILEDSETLLLGKEVELDIMIGKFKFKFIFDKKNCAMNSHK